MSARARMTMRAKVSRTAARATDAWNRPGLEDFSGPVVTTLPCFAWSKLRRQIMPNGTIAAAEELRAIFPGGANLREGDRLEIHDRRGQLVFSGPVAVEALPVRAPATTSKHFEAALRRHV